MNRRDCLQRISHSVTAPLLWRTAGLAAVTGSAGLLSACAGPQVADYATQTPALDLRTYFNGKVDAWGVFTDRSGRVVKRFKVEMDCQWQGDEGVLDEAFTYADGTQQRRIWKLKALPEGRYEGRADDVVGMAAGEVRGNAFRWQYTLALPVDGTLWHVQFDDWMYLMDEQVMMNKAVMRKWGVTLGEVTLSFKRRLPNVAGRVS
jgi:hypothetical protein